MADHGLSWLIMALFPPSTVRRGWERRCVWTHVEPSGAVSSHLEPSGAIWGHLEPSGATWSRLEPSGAIWSQSCRDTLRGPLIGLSGGSSAYTAAVNGRQMPLTPQTPKTQAVGTSPPPPKHPQNASCGNLFLPTATAQAVGTSPPLACMSLGTRAPCIYIYIIT